MRNEYDVDVNENGDFDDDVDTDLAVNVLSGEFAANLPIQLGGSAYDCTTHL